MISKAKRVTARGRKKMPINEKLFIEWSQKVLEELVQFRANLTTIDSKQDQKMSEIVSSFNDKLDQLGKRFQVVEHLLTGNGSPERGLIMRLDRIEQANPHDMRVRLDRLEQDDKRRNWWVRAAVVASLAALAEGLAGMFRGH